MEGKVLTFYLCDRLFGIDITMVKEINRNIKYTPVPRSRDYIVGLFNMRGQVVTLFDIGKRLEYEEGCNKNRPTCITLKPKTPDADLVGFLIDRPGDVLEVGDHECEPLPANISAVEAKFLKEVIKKDTELIMLIDTEEIFQHEL